MKTIRIQNLNDLDRAAQEFLEKTKGSRVFAFDAPMGTGKTTFITAICKALGISEVVNSPTFAIVNEYDLPNAAGVVYHMDCYRLEDVDAALNLGFSDYMESGAYCFIEWPDVVSMLLPENTLWVKIREKEDHSREIIVEDK